MALPDKKYILAEDYFNLEEASENKNEYFYGEIFAMSGASFNHNVIAMNFSSTLHQKFQKTNCFVFPGDMKIELIQDLHYVYPDISVVCGDINFVKNRNDIIKNPLVVIEVLSKSTMDYDKGSKFTSYRKINSLNDYILVDQYSYHVEHFYKNSKNEWILNEFLSVNDSFIIKSIDIEILLKIIYNRVKISKSELLT